MKGIEVIDIEKIKDPRGNLAVLEEKDVGFPIKRVYYLFDVPSDSRRGGHAHIEQVELLIAISGSFDVILDNGKEQEQIKLNKPTKGLLIAKGIWRELEDFSAGSVCLVLNSGKFKESDYIRDYKEFVSFKGR